MATFACEDRIPVYGINEMGSTRMGADRKTPVLNQFQRALDVKTMFVMDAPGVPSGGRQNSTRDWIENRRSQRFHLLFKHLHSPCGKAQSAALVARGPARLAFALACEW